MNIKKIISGVLLSSAALTMTGCGTIQNYETAVNSWNGAPENTLIQRWGYPSETEKLATGNHVDVYRHFARSTYSPALTPGVTPVQAFNNNTLSATPANGSYSLECSTLFEVNPKGVIVNASFSGSDCSATQTFAEQKAYLK